MAVMSRKTKPLKERFWVKVKKGRGCWEWQASTDKDGYGQIGGFGKSGNRTMLKAHRVSLEMSGVHIPKGKKVCHKCDNPKCVNPRHLYVGTDHMNHMDMVKRGRSTTGERNARSKLTAPQVRAIRKVRATGVRLRVLAEEYGVSESCICVVANGKGWRHV